MTSSIRTLTLCFSIIFYSTSLSAQLKMSIFTGTGTDGENLEVCYTLENTSNTERFLEVDKQQGITVLYGTAPLNGYVTRQADCLGLEDFQFVNTHPDITEADIQRRIASDKFLELRFKVDQDIRIPAGQIIDLFCINIEKDQAGCDDLVYWAFCDDDVADTFFNDFEVFPLQSTCVQGEF